jgi:hypothetical protein
LQKRRKQNVSQREKKGLGVFSYFPDWIVGSDSLEYYLWVRFGFPFFTQPQLQQQWNPTDNVAAHICLLHTQIPVCTQLSVAHTAVCHSYAFHMCCEFESCMPRTISHFLKTPSIDKMNSSWSCFWPTFEQDR